jgi:hypothetical protein
MPDDAERFWSSWSVAVLAVVVLGVATTRAFRKGSECVAHLRRDANGPLTGFGDVARVSRVVFAWAAISWTILVERLTATR